MRCQSLAAVDHYLQVLYGPSVECTERLLTKEWALPGSVNGGEIPPLHRLAWDESVIIEAEAWNSRIFEAGRETQNYDKGIERFVRKSNPELEFEAVLAIVKGAHHEHGTAVYVTQEKRRCLLLDTLYGLTDDEALWYTLRSWAKFQPRAKSPSQVPGQLYYPADYSHVFEKYWDTLPNPLSYPEASVETEFTQACMTQYSAALSEMDTSSFTPLVDGEAKQSHVSIAQEAAISRLCPIQDAYDFWSLLEGRSSPDLVGGALHHFA